MVHEMKLNSKPFERIKSGRQTIELRLLDEKRQKLMIGDEIVFTNKDVQSEPFRVKVIAFHVYDSFETLYKHVDKTMLGYLNDEDASPDDLLKYYSREQQDKHSVVGIEIVIV